MSDLDHIVSELERRFGSRLSELEAKVNSGRISLGEHPDDRVLSCTKCGTVCAVFDERTRELRFHYRSANVEVLIPEGGEIRFSCWRCGQRRVERVE